MKSLKQTIQENFKFKINRNKDVYAHHPTTFDELRQIIEKRYKEFGPGTISNPIDFNDIDVSGMTKFFEDRGLFENTKFGYIDVSKWDVSNIKTMNSMFYDCNKLESIGDISNWNVSNIKTMKYMFNNCKNLKSVGDLSKWDISNVEYMNEMFADSGITNIPSWYKK